MRSLIIAMAAAMLAIAQATAAGVEPLPAGRDTTAPIVVRFDARGKSSVDAVYDQLVAYVSTTAAIDRVELVSSRGGKRRDLGIFPRDGADDEVLALLKTMTPPQTRVSRNSVIDRRNSTQARAR